MMTHFFDACAKASEAAWPTYLPLFFIFSGGGGRENEKSLQKKGVTGVVKWVKTQHFLSCASPIVLASLLGVYVA